jgi:hypothetical protein
MPVSISRSAGCKSYRLAAGLFALLKLGGSFARRSDAIMDRQKLQFY